MITFKDVPPSPPYSRLRYEFDKLMDPRWCGVVYNLSLLVKGLFGLDLVITQLFRSEEENEAMGGGKRSAHKVGRAGDLRSTIFTLDDREPIDNWLERVYGKEYLYWIWHNSGHGEHLHLQIRYKYARWDEKLKEGFERKRPRNLFFTEAI